MSELNQRARARIRPYIVQVSIPTPTVVTTLSVALGPKAITVTKVTPTVTLGVAPSPKAVTVTIVTPTVLIV